MKSKYILIGLLVLIAGLLAADIILRVYLWTFSAEIFNNLVTPLTGLMTVVLGFWIYRDLGFRKKIKDKQFDTVESFIQELRSMRFEVMMIRNGQPMFWTRIYAKRNNFIQHRVYAENRKKDDDGSLGNIFEMEITVSGEAYIEAFNKLEKIKNSLYMPPSLVDKITLPIIHTPYIFKEVGNENFLRMSVNATPNSGSIERWCCSVGEKVTYNQFVEGLKMNLLLTTNWIETHSGRTGELNI